VCAVRRDLITSHPHPALTLATPTPANAPADDTRPGSPTLPAFIAASRSCGIPGTSTSAAGVITPSPTNRSYVSLIAASNPSNDSGTAAPASRSAAFLACADSASPPLRAPAWPNWTSDLKSLAQVPLTQATTGLETWGGAGATGEGLGVGWRVGLWIWDGSGYGRGCQLQRATATATATAIPLPPKPTTTATTTKTTQHPRRPPAAHLARLERLHQRVLVLPPQLPQHHDHLDLGDVLVADAVVGQRAAGEGVAADGDALVCGVCVCVYVCV